jgi:hypothetical protein
MGYCSTQISVTFHNKICIDGFICMLQENYTFCPTMRHTCALLVILLKKSENHFKQNCRKYTYDI